MECQFHNKLIKFTSKDFDTPFGLWVKGSDVCISKALKFVKFDLVKHISKFVLGDSLEMKNFHISQVKFEMRILHWIVLKLLYRKPCNWARADDPYLYLMWVLLLSDICFNWVTFILQRIEHCRFSPKTSLFFSSFIQFILELNGITFIEKELVKALKHVDSTAISLMCYYQDKNKKYYYLDTDGSRVYEDRIVKPKKKKRASSTKELIHHLLGYFLITRKRTLMICLVSSWLIIRFVKTRLWAWLKLWKMKWKKAERK